MFPIGIVQIPHSPPRARKASSSNSRGGADGSKQHTIPGMAHDAPNPSNSHEHGKGSQAGRQDTLLGDHAEDHLSACDFHEQPKRDKPLPSEPSGGDPNASQNFDLNDVSNTNEAGHIGWWDKEHSLSNNGDNHGATDGFGVVYKSVAPSILSTETYVNASTPTINKRVWLSRGTNYHCLRRPKTSNNQKRNLSATTFQPSPPRLIDISRADGSSATLPSRRLGHTWKGRLFKRSQTDFRRFRPHAAIQSDTALICGNESKSKNSLVRPSFEAPSFISAAFSRRKSKERLAADPFSENLRYRHRRLCPYKEVAGCGARLKIVKGSSLLLTGIASKDSLVPSDGASIGRSQPRFEDPTQASSSQQGSTGSPVDSHSERRASGETFDTRARLQMDRVYADTRIKSRTGEADSDRSELPTVLDIPVSFNSAELGRGQMEYDSPFTGPPPPIEEDLTETESINQEVGSNYPEAIIDKYNHSECGSDASPKTAIHDPSSEPDHTGLSVPSGSNNRSAPSTPLAPTLSTEALHSFPESLNGESSNDGTSPDVISVEGEGSDEANPTLEGQLASNYMGTIVSRPRPPPAPAHRVPTTEMYPEDSAAVIPDLESGNGWTLNGSVNPRVPRGLRAGDRSSAGVRTYDSGIGNSIDPSLAWEYFGNADDEYYHETSRYTEDEVYNGITVTIELLALLNCSAAGERRRQHFTALSSLLVDALTAARVASQATISAERYAEEARVTHNIILAKLAEIRRRVDERVAEEAAFMGTSEEQGTSQAD